MSAIVRLAKVLEAGRTTASSRGRALADEYKRILKPFETNLRQLR